jgi:hypothetical protein
MLINVPKRFIYAQQNLRRRTPLLVWTLRLRAIWLHRNIFILIFLYQQLSIKKIQYQTRLQPTYILNSLISLMLIKQVYYLLTHVSPKSNAIATSKFAHSCEYWVIKHGISYLELNIGEEAEHKPFAYDKHWYVFYTSPKTLIDIFLSKKFYKTVLVKLMQLLIYNWPVLNARRVYISGYLLFTTNWYYVRFLFLRYFRVLNF